MTDFGALSARWLSLPRDGWGGLVRGGIHLRAFLRDLTSPDRRDWFHACRSLAASGSDIEAPMLDEILAEIGRWDPARTTMAKAHIECARFLREARPGRLVPPVRLLLIAEQHALPIGLIRDLCSELAEPENPSESSVHRPGTVAAEVSSPLLLIKSKRKRLETHKLKRKGVVATLTLQLIGGGRGELYPAPAMAFIRCDSGFLGALANARTFLRSAGLWGESFDVRWHLRLQGDKPPPALLKGDSAGAGFALACAKLLAHAQSQNMESGEEINGESLAKTEGDPLRSARLPDLLHVAVSASITASGELGGVGGFFKKLVAVAREPLSQIVAVMASAEQKDIEGFGFEQDPLNPNIFHDCRGNLGVFRGTTLEEVLGLWVVNQETPRAKVIDCTPELKRHRQLVHRSGLAERLARFETEASSGVFLIVGEPGTGKTAFVAKCIEGRKSSRPVYHIIKRRRWDEEWDKPSAFFRVQFKGAVMRQLLSSFSARERMFMRAHRRETPSYRVLLPADGWIL